MKVLENYYDYLKWRNTQDILEQHKDLEVGDYVICSFDGKQSRVEGKKVEKGEKYKIKEISGNRKLYKLEGFPDKWWSFERFMPELYYNINKFNL